MAEPTLRLVLPRDIPWLVKLTTAEGWAMSNHELQVHARAFEKDFFVALKDGTPVGCVLATRISDDTGFLGLLVVDARHRGAGIGRLLLRAALDHLEIRSGLRNIGLNAERAMVDTYRKYGFHVQSWTVSCFKGAIKPQCLATFKCDLPNVQVYPLDETNLSQVLLYDKSLHTMERQCYFKALMAMPQVEGKVAIQQGKVVGFGILMPDLRSVCFLVGPLYADSVQIARAILWHMLFDRNTVPPGLYAEIPGPNVDKAGELFSGLGIGVNSTMSRQYTLYEPAYAVDKVFCLINGDTHPV